MKCIKALKESKYAKVGDIVRLKENDANDKVDTGYWTFVSKTEWKTFRKPVEESVKTSVTDSKSTTKVLDVESKRKKYKK